MPEATYATYAEIKARLDEIVAAAADDDMPLDDALALYEEAVRLGLAASDLIEQDIADQDAEAAEAADAATDAVAEAEPADGAAAGGAQAADGSHDEAAEGGAAHDRAGDAERD